MVSLIIITIVHRH